MSDAFNVERAANGSSAPRRAAQPIVQSIPILDAASAVTVEIEVLKESYDELVRLAKVNDMGVDEGLRTFLLTGLGYYDAQLHLGKINAALHESDPKSAQHIEALVQDLASYHSMYSVLKFKTYKLYKLSQKLEFKVAGLGAAEQMWEEWAGRLRSEHKALQAEVVRLRAIVSEFRIDGEPLSISMGEQPVQAEKEAEAPEPQHEEKAEPEARPSFWARLRYLFGR